MSSALPSDPTYWGLAALAAFLLFVWQARWVYHDAHRRGHDPRLAILFFVVLWPLSIPIWFLARSGRHLAPKGYGSGWG